MELALVVATNVTTLDIEDEDVAESDANAVSVFVTEDVDDFDS